MKFKFNGISPWVLFKVYRKERNTVYFKFWSLMWFSHFIGQSGYSTPASILNYYELGRLSQQDVTKGDLQEEETMNDNLTTQTNTTAFKPVPVEFPVDADGEFFKLVATKPVDGTAAYLTEADETADEPTPTIH